MKKMYVLFILSFVTFFMVSAKPVDENTAKTIGFNFITKLSARFQGKTPGDLKLIYAPGSTGSDNFRGGSTLPAYYVFSFTEIPGFIIISGDDAVTPILGYSTTSYFSKANLPPALSAWLNNYEEQIKFAVTRKLEATPETESEWEKYLTPATKTPVQSKGVAGVEPLIRLTWSQSPYYNTLCPMNKDSAKLTVTGCVATAMAMVMKYYNYPKTGTGFYSYDTKKYGTLSANFGDTRYNWAAMPDTGSLTSENKAVATLMYHCGISAKMEYGLASVGGSGAWMISAGDTSMSCSEKALVTYFGYAATLHGLNRNNYPDYQWIDFLKEDLDASRPVMYTAYDPGPKGGGHCFICDGYDNNNKFHFNWGWGGIANGYFEINALTPYGDNYVCSHSALLGIKPGAAQNLYFKLNLNAPVTSVASTIKYEDSLSFHTDIYNNDLKAFNGDIAAAIFDTNEVFIDMVEIKNGITLNSGEHFTDGITFKNSGLPVMLPGEYNIVIMYKSGNTGWVEVGDTLSYINNTEVKVINPDNIGMASGMTISPGVVLTQGQPVNVKLEIRNNGSTDFSGSLNLAIHDIDGIYMNTIEQKANFNLPAGASSGELSFSSSRINNGAGSYMIALWYIPAGSQEWKLIGSTGYPNPVRVQVNAQPLSPDKYEPNDSIQIATVLPVSFSGNQTQIKLQNANCHTGKDFDFYTVALPAGNSYVVNVSLAESEYDSTHSNPLNGDLNYRLLQDTVWKSPCNNNKPSKIEVMNGGTVVLLVSPNFIAKTGLYQLYIDISKNPLGMQEPDNANELLVYPNPARDEIFMKDLTGSLKISACVVLSTDGRIVLRTTPSQQGAISRISVSTLSQGLYILQAMTTSGTVSRKISIIK
ncbi:MAG: thiol protease/hemagglutinin PrtT [Bacteroidales bacterium]|nr:thiol protease/hemagglutinin PrtT [Bacteroidales bacterium]